MELRWKRQERKRIGALVAESIAARETIRFANRFFHEEVVLEGDSTEVLGYQP